MCRSLRHNSQKLLPSNFAAACCKNSVGAKRLADGEAQKVADPPLVHGADHGTGVGPDKDSPNNGKSCPCKPEADSAVFLHKTGERHSSGHLIAGNQLRDSRG
jgi:hypothetical protein